jgi:hypothetical protein
MIWLLVFPNGECDNLEGFRAFAAGADVFLAYAGEFDVWNLVAEVPRRVCLDVDPG